MDHPHLDMFPEPVMLAKTSAPALPTELPAVPLRDADAMLILTVVAQSYALTVDDIRSECRLKSFAEARLVAYWLLRTRTKLSFPELGHLLRKNHTSVMSGARKCIDKRAKDAGFCSFTDKLAAAVGARLKSEAAA